MNGPFVEPKYGYVYFSNVTTGVQGRAVYIDPLLLPQFLSLINPWAHNGQEVVKCVNQMTALSVDQNTYSNRDNAFLHMKAFGNVQIYFYVFQGDQNHEPGIYIADVRRTLKQDNNRPGLYRVSGSGGGLTIQPQSSKVVADRAACINAATRDIDHAADLSHDTLKKFDLHGDGWGTKFSLFYLPTHLFNELGVWITPQQKSQSPAEVARELAEVLKQTQNRRRAENREPLEWLVVAEGAEILQMAIDLLEADSQLANLEKHRFRFLHPNAPRHGLSHMIKKLKHKGAEFETEAVVAGSRPSAVATAIDLKELGEALETRFHGANIQDLNNRLANLAKDFGSAAGLLLNRDKACTTNFMEVIDNMESLKQW